MTRLRACIHPISVRNTHEQVRAESAMLVPEENQIQKCLYNTGVGCDNLLRLVWEILRRKDLKLSLR